MATHSSILAWRIPGTEETGGPYGLWGYTESERTEVTAAAAAFSFGACAGRGQPRLWV